MPENILYKHKKIVYFVVKSLCASLYLILVLLMGYFFKIIAGGSFVLAVIIMTPLFAFVFYPLKIKVDRGIDKRFLKHNCKYCLAVKNLSKKIAEAKSMDELNFLVSTEIKDAVRAGGAKIQLFE